MRGGTCAPTGARLLPSSISIEGEFVRIAISISGLPSTEYIIRLTFLDDGITLVDVDVPITTDVTGSADILYYVDQPQIAGGTRTFVSSRILGPYSFRFQVPKVGTGCYKINWDERVLSESGDGFDSVGVISRGVYRPIVQTSIESGGESAVLVAVMNSSGGVASVSILNPGYYLAPPTISVTPAINGGTSSTGWVATLDGSGRIISVTGGTAGDYLPVIAVTGANLGTAASFSVSMDSQGGIGSVSVTTAGLYSHVPEVSITQRTASTSIFAEAIIHPHIGTEVHRCETWDGITPEDYNPEDQDTWPIISSEGPADEGAQPVNILATCNCAVCE